MPRWRKCTWKSGISAHTRISSVDPNIVKKNTCSFPNFISVHVNPDGRIESHFLNCWSIQIGSMRCDTRARSHTNIPAHRHTTHALQLWLHKVRTTSRKLQSRNQPRFAHWQAWMTKLRIAQGQRKSHTSKQADTARNQPNTFVSSNNWQGSLIF